MRRASRLATFVAREPEKEGEGAGISFPSCFLDSFIFFSFGPLCDEFWTFIHSSALFLSVKWDDDFSKIPFDSIWVQNFECLIFFIIWY